MKLTSQKCAQSPVTYIEQRFTFGHCMSDDEIFFVVKSCFIFVSYYRKIVQYGEHFTFEFKIGTSLLNLIPARRLLIGYDLFMAIVTGDTIRFLQKNDVVVAIMCVH